MHFTWTGLAGTAFTALASFSSVEAATAADWRSRSIYQIFTDRFARTDGNNQSPCANPTLNFCGGTWQGIINHLDYIQGMHFDAIWISPVVKNMADPSRAFHGYSALDIYSLNSNFGTANDLKALAQALHSRGMYLMVDVVTNHFGAPGPAGSVDYTQFNPFNSQSYFHPVCFISNYQNQTEVEVCDIGSNDYPLPDVDTTQAGVRTAWQNWIKYMVSTYSIDGIRIDSVKNVEMAFWKPFNQAAGVYAVGEVSDGNVDYVCPYTNALDGVLDYPSYWQATQFFSDPTATSANFVSEFNYMKQKCKDMTTLGPFSENHDQARFASHTSDIVLAKNIMAWTLLADGVPILYQGQEQHLNGAADPYDREAIWLTNYDTSAPLYKFAQQMNAIRKLAIAKSSTYVTSPSSIVYSDSHNLAFRKGDPGSMILNVVNNLGSSAQTYTVKIPNAGFTAGITVVDVLSCRQVVVGSDGSLSAYFTGGLPMIYYPKTLLTGSGWCGF